jgi:6-phosphogluconolactonase
LTLTLPVLNAASNVWFLVSGREKADALRRVITGAVDDGRLPASAVRPVEGDLIWWVDEGAATSLEGVRVLGVQIVRQS